MNFIKDLILVTQNSLSLYGRVGYKGRLVGGYKLEKKTICATVCFRICAVIRSHFLFELRKWVFIRSSGHFFSTANESL